MPFTKEQFTGWIEAADSGYGQVRTEYDNARDYFEDEQAPSNVPSDKEYIQVNLVNDLVRRRTGEIVSGGIKPVIEGGGKAAKPLKFLFNDILEENKFGQLAFPAAINYFYNEGFAGFKFEPNPFKVGKYGVGTPIIHYLRPDELRLDPDARDGFHSDDNFRVHAKRVTLDYAKRRFSDHADEITSSMNLSEDGSQTERQYVDLYEIEYKETEFTDVDGARIEEDVYYIVKMVNKTVMVTEPEKTGYPTFRLIPLIHTPRIKNAGKYPFGINKITKQSQDQYNITQSVILEWVKAQIKQLVIGRGLRPEEEEKLKMEAAKTNGVVGFQNPNARIDVVTGNPIPPGLLQWADGRRLAFDEISGSFAPERGAVDGDLSGKAIGRLQTAGAIPEFVAKMNIESALTDLGVCVFYYMTKVMKQPFSIFPEVNGQENPIAFNTVVERGFEGDEFHVYHGGSVNVLTQMGVRRVKIEVEMNVLQREEIEMNKALLMRERGDMSLMDVMKALYPTNWQEKFQNIKSESEIQALVQDILETAPEFVTQIAQQWQQLKPELEKQQQELNGRLTGGLS